MFYPSLSQLHGLPEVVCWVMELFFHEERQPPSHTGRRVCVSPLTLRLGTFLAALILLKFNLPEAHKPKALRGRQIIMNVY